MDSRFSFLIAFTAVASGFASILAREEASFLITAGFSHFETLVVLVVFAPEERVAAADAASSSSEAGLPDGKI